MKRRALLHGVCLCLGILLFSGVTGSSTGKIALPSQSQPQFFVFRGEYAAGRLGREEWLAHIGPTSGLIKKFWNEELTRIPAKTATWARERSVENPEQLMLWHINAEGRQIADPLTTQKHFPGHFVYLPGSTLTQSVEAGDTSLQVADTRPFKMNAYQFGNESKKNQPHYLLIVPIDAAGRRDWYAAEYARLTAINPASKIITVQRGACFSTPRSFEGGKTLLLPIDGAWWGEGILFFYNMALTCPRDAQGKQAADVFLDEIRSRLVPGGELDFMDGMALDVMYWHARSPLWDTDNDNVGDSGISSQRPVWRLGVQKFLRDLRQAVGPDFLLVADCFDEENQQAVDVLNGIESEGLVAPNDGWRGFSQTINIHRYWGQYSTALPRFSYIHRKLNSPQDEAQADNLRRLALGTALCLGLATTVSDGRELEPELAAGPGWMGAPAGPFFMPELGAQATDLLKGAGVAFSQDFLANLHTQNCTVQRLASGELQITGSKTGDPFSECVLEIPLPDTAQSDITLVFETRAVEGLPAASPEAALPRTVRIIHSGITDRHERDIMGLFGTRGYSSVQAYFRKPQTPAATRSVLELHFEGQGALVLKNLRLLKAAPVMAREFAHALVLANPSLQPVSVHPARLFPQARMGSTGELQVAPLDALIVKKPE